MSELNHEVVLLLGSNMEDPFRQLEQACRALVAAGLNILKASSIYQSPPWGPVEQDDFLNQALLCSTSYSPHDLLKEAKKVERRAGKRPAIQWGPRPLDIDILFYDNAIIQETHLIIPHPLLHQRMFTLVPLLEIIPDHVHPVFNKTIESLFLECSDSSEVIMLETDGDTTP